MNLFFNGFYEINRCCNIDYVKLLAIRQLLQKRYENVLTSATKSVPSPYRYSTAAFKHYLKIHKLITIKMNYPSLLRTSLIAFYERCYIDVKSTLTKNYCWNNVENCLSTSLKNINVEYPLTYRCVQGAKIITQIDCETNNLKAPLSSMHRLNTMSASDIVVITLNKHWESSRRIMQSHKKQSIEKCPL